MTCEPELRSWWTSSLLTHLQVALLMPPSISTPTCPSLGVSHGWCLCWAAPRCKANWVHWRPRQSIAWPLPPQWRPWPETGSPTQWRGHTPCLTLLHLWQKPTSSHVTAGFSASPQALRLVREESSRYVVEAKHNWCSGEQMSKHPQMEA